MQKCAVSHHTACCTHPVFICRYLLRVFIYAYTHTGRSQHTPLAGPLPPHAPESLCRPPKALGTAGAPQELAQAPRPAHSPGAPCVSVQHPHTYAYRVTFQKLVMLTFPSSQMSNPCIVQHCISCGRWNCVQILSKKGQQVRTAKNSSLKKSLPPFTVLSHGSSPPSIGWGVSWGNWEVSRLPAQTVMRDNGSVTILCIYGVPFAPGSWSTLQSDAGSLTPPVR